MSKNIPVFEQWPFRVPSFEREIEKSKAFTEALKNAATQEEALAVIKKKMKASDDFDNSVTLISVKFSLESNNPKYVKAMDVVNEKYPLLQNEELAFSKALLESKFRPYLEEKLGSLLFKMHENSLKSFDERVIEESIEENKLTMQYGALIASCEVEFRGEKYNLPQMGKFMEDPDRKTREEASKAYYSYMDSKVAELEDIYDKLVKVRDRMAKKLGFENYVPLGYLRMSRFDYTKEDVKGYRDAIAQYVTPLAGKLLKQQFKRTGIRNPEIYDLALAFKDGNPTPKGTTAEKIETAKGMYDQMSPETSYFFRFMADHHVLDLEARAGKQSGGYMTYFPKYGIPFIFSNFNGTSGDVDVLTHEFGHSFQAYMSRAIKIPEYRQPTSESCEIHSMSMEFFAHPYMDRFFDNPERYRFVHLSDSISFLPYGVSVDEFQEWVYEHPEATPEERDAEWIALEEKYLPHKRACYKGCKYMAEGHRWLTQAHIFESPFYYIDYTLAQVMAFEFFNLDRKNHALAWKRYLNLCKMGGKYPFRTLVSKAHMKDPFQEGVIKKTIAPLPKVLAGYNID